MKSYSVTTQMKATEQYFPVAQFITQNKMILTFESVDEILNCDIHMKAIGTVYHAVQGGANV